MVDDAKVSGARAVIESAADLRKNIDDFARAAKFLDGLTQSARRGIVAFAISSSEDEHAGHVIQMIAPTRNEKAQDQCAAHASGAARGIAVFAETRAVQQCPAGNCTLQFTFGRRRLRPQLFFAS
jgi:predicted RNA-binding Zn ribbon-like protein